MTTPENNSKKNNIRWGIIGPGSIARKFAHDIKLSAHGELVAVASRNIERAEAFGHEFGASEYFGSYQALAASKNVDVIYIATPHHLHFENALMCIQHGKSVLCEKPMGLDKDQVQSLIEEADKYGVFLMEGMWTRFIPTTLKLLDLLDQNTIGELTDIKADFGFKGEYNPENRLFNKSLGGGSLMDIGIYPVFISQLIFGQPQQIQASARMSETGVDASIEMIFNNENNTRSDLYSTFEENTPLEAVISGSKGQIKLHKPFHHSELISIYRNDELVEQFELPIIGHGYTFEIDEVNTCIMKGLTESPRYPLSESLELIETLDRVKVQIGLDYSV